MPYGPPARDGALIGVRFGWAVRRRLLGDGVSMRHASRCVAADVSLGLDVRFGAHWQIDTPSGLFLQFVQQQHHFLENRRADFYVDVLLGHQAQVYRHHFLLGLYGEANDQDGVFTEHHVLARCVRLVELSRLYCGLLLEFLYGFRRFGREVFFECCSNHALAAFDDRPGDIACQPETELAAVRGVEPEQQSIFVCGPLAAELFNRHDGIAQHVN